MLNSLFSSINIVSDKVLSNIYFMYLFEKLKVFLTFFIVFSSIFVIGLSIEHFLVQSSKGKKKVRNKKLLKIFFTIIIIFSLILILIPTKEFFLGKLILSILSFSTN